MESAREESVEDVSRQITGFDLLEDEFPSRDYIEDIRSTRISENDQPSRENKREYRLGQLKLWFSQLQTLKDKLFKLEKDVLRDYNCSINPNINEYTHKLNIIRVQKIRLEDKEMKLKGEIYVLETNFDPEMTTRGFLAGLDLVRAKNQQSRRSGVDGLFSRDSQTFRSSMGPDQRPSMIHETQSPQRPKKSFVISDESYRKSIQLDEERRILKEAENKKQRETFDIERKIEERPLPKKPLRQKMNSEKPPFGNWGENPFLSHNEHQGSLFFDNNRKLEKNFYRTSFNPLGSLKPGEQSREILYISRVKPLQSRDRSPSDSIEFNDSPFKGYQETPKRHHQNSPILANLVESSEFLIKKNRKAPVACRRVTFASARNKHTFFEYPETSLYPIPSELTHMIHKKEGIKSDDDCDSTDSIIHMGKERLYSAIKQSISDLPKGRKIPFRGIAASNR